MSQIASCESEPLHLSGAIQGCGALLCVDGATGVITHASANAQRYTGIPVETLLGAQASVLPWWERARWVELASESGKTKVVAGVYESTFGVVDALLIRAGDGVLVELEVNAAHPHALEVEAYQRQLMVIPRRPDQVASYHQCVLQAVQTVIGFDRLMVYQFAEDWSGEVVAEQMGAGLGSYLGLRFPASDIPAIARNLYALHPARVIADVAAAVVPIQSWHGEMLDLTWSGLRSVSPMHLQYLANMGVQASFSVPIRVNNKLWGLVACHHAQPRALHPSQRRACVEMVATYSLGLSAFLAGWRLQVIDSINRRVAQIADLLFAHHDPFDGLESQADVLMAHLEAHGVAMAVRDDVAWSGECGGVDDLALLDRWFVQESKELVFSTDRLSQVFPGWFTSGERPICGVLAVKARSIRFGWIRFYWFRVAEPYQVVWAGNPDKSMADTGAGLSPRHSFAQWVESRTDYSRAWSVEEKLVASKFRLQLSRWSVQ